MCHPVYIIEYIYIYVYHILHIDYTLYIYTMYYIYYIYIYIRTIYVYINIHFLLHGLLGLCGLWGLYVNPLLPGALGSPLRDTAHGRDLHQVEGAPALEFDWDPYVCKMGARTYRPYVCTKNRAVYYRKPLICDVSNPETDIMPLCFVNSLNTNLRSAVVRTRLWLDSRWCILVVAGRLKIETV